MYGVMDKVICFDICRIVSLCGTTVVTSTKKRVMAHFLIFRLPKDNDVNNSESQNSAIHRVSLKSSSCHISVVLANHTCEPCKYILGTVTVYLRIFL